VGMHDDPWRFHVASSQFAFGSKTSRPKRRACCWLSGMTTCSIRPSMPMCTSIISCKRSPRWQLLRRDLIDRVPPETVSGEQGRVVLPTEQYTVLRPRMIEVNALIEQLRKDAHQGVMSAGSLLDQLQNASSGSGSSCLTRSAR